MKQYFTIPPFWLRGSRPRINIPQHVPRFLQKSVSQPRFVRNCPVTQAFIQRFSKLNWDSLPLTLGKERTGFNKVPLCAYVGSFLLKIDQHQRTFGKLHCFLRYHPALLWALGFPIADWDAPAHCSAAYYLPTQQHFSRKLSDVPNELLQNFLDGQVEILRLRLGDHFGETISLDTKHILAWVKENNPKQFVDDRFNKEKQPSGDPDCKLGCKKRKNQITPSREGQPAGKQISVGEYYWGYGSGIIATKVKNVGEFVLAEITQTFDHSDVSYFFPLVTQVESRLGRRPKYFTADAAFDSFYIYDYFFHEEENGFAAIPLRKTGTTRHFDSEGLPLCDANLSMPLKTTFVNRTSFVQHERGRYVCPLLHPSKSAETCPVAHPKWGDGGCKLVMPTAKGARIRYQLNRENEGYKQVFAQRTASERLFSQAVELGIERPKLRNQQAIANHNTLIYVVINSRAIERAQKSFDVMSG